MFFLSPCDFDEKSAFWITTSHAYASLLSTRVLAVSYALMIIDQRTAGQDVSPLLSDNVLTLCGVAEIDNSVIFKKKNEILSALCL